MCIRYIKRHWNRLHNSPYSCAGKEPANGQTNGVTHYGSASLAHLARESHALKTDFQIESLFCSLPLTGVPAKCSCYALGEINPFCPHTDRHKFCGNFLQQSTALSILGLMVTLLYFNTVPKLSQKLLGQKCLSKPHDCEFSVLPRNTRMICWFPGPRVIRLFVFAIQTGQHQTTILFIVRTTKKRSRNQNFSRLIWEISAKPCFFFSGFHKFWVGIARRAKWSAI